MYLLLLIVLMYFSVCRSDPKLVPSSIGWEEVRGPQFKYVAYIQDLKREHVCLGIIMAESVIVTLCSCFLNYERYHPKLTKVRIVAGSNFFWPAGPGYQVRLSDFVRRMADCVKNNLILVKPNVPFVFNSWVAPIPPNYISIKQAREESIPDYQKQNEKVRDEFKKNQEEQEDCLFVGFGGHHEYSHISVRLPMETTLKKTHVKLIPQQVCMTELQKCCKNRWDYSFEKKVRVEDLGVSICTASEWKFKKEERTVLCDGDMGGPLICDGKVWGILGNTFQCGLSNAPLLYVDLLTSFFNGSRQEIFL